MKKTFTTLLLMGTMYGLSAQTTQPGSTKPVSNPTLSSSASQSNNSNSGVNPNGNPGTIINNTTNSNATTSGLVQPVTPAPPPAYYTTTDTVPVRTTTQVKSDTTMTATAGIVPGDSVLKEPVLTEADAPIISDTQNIVTSGVAPDGNIAGQNMALSAQASYGYDEATLIGLSRFAALPQLNTWVPENVVSAISSRFGNTLYDITMVKAVAGEEKYIYVVRTQENGIFETQTVTDVE